MRFPDVPLRRIATRLVGLAVVALLAVGSAGPQARAQGFGWFGNIFGGGTPAPRRVAPPRPSFPGYGYYEPPSADYPSPRRRIHKSRPVEQATREAAPKEKTPPKNASLFVDVFGDSLGQMLANGLDDALADRGDVAVIHRAKGSTGLVSSDFYDWPKSIETLLAEKPKVGGDQAKGSEQNKAGELAKSGERANGEERAKGESAEARTKGKPAPDADDDTKTPQRIDVAVMMIGSNDRQAIMEGDKTLEPGTPEWSAAYRKRVQRIDEAFKRKGIALIWVGVPITKDDTFADDMAALNDIYRDVAAQDGATYVDTWEAFSDDNGDFSAFGPDVNGQTVRLRSADGIHFTKAGARKLAHFVEVHIRRALDGKTRPAELPTADAGKASGPVAKAEAGPIKNLNEAPVSADGRLVTLTPPVPTQKEAEHAPSASLAPPLQPQPGRVDDARWANGTPEP